MRKLLILAIVSLPAMFISETEAQWFQPYPNGSADDHLIRFDGGPTNDVVAPDPAVGVGYTYSNTPTVGVGGGWNISASGAVGLGDGEDFSAQSNAYTEAGGQNLRFGAESMLGQNLPDASLTMTWSGQATIPGSTTWATQTNNFRYEFSLALDHKIVDDFPGLFDGYTLTIKDDNNTLYTGVGLKNILGVAVIDQNMYHDYFVSFTYDQSNGPLDIEWSGSVEMTGATIDSLGNGKMDIVRVHEVRILNEAIPEPSTYALLLGSAVFVGLTLRSRLG